MVITEPSSHRRFGTTDGVLHRSVTAIVGITLLLFLVRVLGPSNLMDNDQERPASYVLDAVLHGHWFCQSDWTGDIMSKPPLFTWVAAVATLPVGRGNLLSLYLPCLLAMLLTVGLLWRFGRENLGWRVGFLAALMYLAAPSGVKHIALARTDALFASLVALTAFLGFRAWTRGGSWVWFWLAGALATLTKGPLGPALGAAALLAVVWEAWSARKTGRPDSAPASVGLPGAASPARLFPIWMSHVAGVTLFLLMAGGWFWLAYREAGQPFVDKVIGRELVGHVVGDKHGTFGVGFIKAPLYWLSRFLPWSLLALVGLWRTFRNPAANPHERRVERFLACWILGGLFLFSLAKHQRGDLPLPLYAPAALLASRELARWIAHWPDRLVLRQATLVTLTALALYTGYLHTVFARTEAVRESEGVAALARWLRSEFPDTSRVLHVDSPYALQFHLNTLERLVPFDRAAAALAGEDPVIVAVANTARLQKMMGPDFAGVAIMAQWPAASEPRLALVTTRERP
jgi:4-amino-4-deoxy-L-arabinose transferase-like glycosyltransferase